MADEARTSSYMEVRFDPKFYKGEGDEFDNYCKRVYGKQMAKRISMVLGHVRAVKNLVDLTRQGFPGRWHWLTGDRKHQLSADLKHPQRLILVPTLPVSEFTRENGSVNESIIIALVVLEIDDTHE